MLKFLKRRWAWWLLAACLMGSVIVVLPALVQLGQESKRGKALQAGLCPNPTGKDLDLIL